MMPIVIVDDSGEDAALARRVLEQCRILNPVQILKSGADCISYFKSSSHEAGTLPCLVLLDLAMSPISGVDVLRYLSHLPASKDSIIVMLSGIQDFNIVREGYQLGAMTFLVKPLRNVDILEMIQAIRGIAVEETDKGYVLSSTCSPASISPRVVASS